jgi:hypothetical protein
MYAYRNRGAVRVLPFDATADGTALAVSWDRWSTLSTVAHGRGSMKA